MVGKGQCAGWDKWDTSFRAVHGASASAKTFHCRTVRKSPSFVCPDNQPVLSIQTIFLYGLTHPFAEANTWIRLNMFMSMPRTVLFLMNRTFRDISLLLNNQLLNKIA